MASSDRDLACGTFQAGEHDGGWAYIAFRPVGRQLEILAGGRLILHLHIDADIDDAIELAGLLNRRIGAVEYLNYSTSTPDKPDAKPHLCQRREAYQAGMPPFS